MVQSKNHVNNGGDPILQSPPLFSSYNDKIRPILDAVDNLRRLNVTQERISLPTIVLVGDQSSGKSSVLESLTGISLPRGQGICTRVPLIMRLQHHQDSLPEFLLQFNGKKVPISSEALISEAINQATVEIAGDNKGISNVPLTLVVKKKGAPDLTMVDLPGITRVPVHNQPEDIYEQISGIIMEHIKPEESIILNVLSAAVVFSTCESVRMSRQVDNTGQRTLAVVTKCDQSPDDLLDKVTANDVNIGLGYICVRNRINNETYDEARVQEATLFQTHRLLSKIDKSMVGIPVLARRLVEIQSMIMSKSLPNIIKKINERLDSSALELKTTVPDAMAVFIRLVGSLTETLQKIVIRGEFDDEYINDKQMHCNARIAEMLDSFSKELRSKVGFSNKFLVEEVEVLEEVNGIRLPHYNLPHSAFLLLLQKKINNISELPINFINKVWAYLETVITRVVVDRCGSYPQLLPSMKKATHTAMAKMKAKLMERVSEMLEMEKITDYTCDPNFEVSWKKLMDNCHDQFVRASQNLKHAPMARSIMRVGTGAGATVVVVDGYGLFDIKHLVGVGESLREEAFDLKMRMTAYWEIVLKRMVDWIALQLRFVVRKMVDTEMEMEIVKEVMMDEPSAVARNREGLWKLLQKSKQVIGKVGNYLFNR